MTTKEIVLLQELVSIRKDLVRLVRVVDSIAQRMKQVERWQLTMDMTLKAMSENN